MESKEGYAGTGIEFPSSFYFTFWYINSSRNVDPTVKGQKKFVCFFFAPSISSPIEEFYNLNSTRHSINVCKSVEECFGRVEFAIRNSRDEVTQKCQDEPAKVAVLGVRLPTIHLKLKQSGY